MQISPKKLLRFYKHRTMKHSCKRKPSVSSPVNSKDMVTKGW